MGHIDNFEIGKAIPVREGSRVAIFSTGAIFEEVSEACNLLQTSGVFPAVFTFPTVKPIDRDLITQASREFEWIVSCEEHNIVGGFGSAVAEVLAELPGARARLLRLGLNDIYAEKVGSQRYLREQYGISAAHIAARIEAVL